MSHLDILHAKILSSEEHAALINSLTEEGKLQVRKLIRSIIIEAAKTDSLINNPDHDDSDPTCANYEVLYYYDITL